MIMFVTDRARFQARRRVRNKTDEVSFLNNELVEPKQGTKTDKIEQFHAFPLQRFS